MLYSPRHAAQSRGTRPTQVRRRDFLAAVATIPVVGAVPWGSTPSQGDMYGQIGRLIAVSGKRDEVIGNILDAVSNMPG